MFTDCGSLGSIVDASYYKLQTEASVFEDGRSHRSKQVELIVVIINPLLLLLFVY